ncbi:MAG TPA: hypothetical protein DCZ12_08500 [Gammaproteobacteria bacterium]|nr:hypothetical protein [Gammaproteobacteria bacterium]
MYFFNTKTRRTLGRSVGSLTILLLSPGCTTLAPHHALSSPAIEYRSSELATHCLAQYEHFDETVKEHKAADSGATRIPGYPYLRTNRFLASFQHELDSQEKLTFWLSEMAKIDNKKRQIEYKNLPLSTQKKISPQGEKALFNQLKNCSDWLQHQDIAHPQSLLYLKENAQVPSDYNPHARWPGIHPLVNLFLRKGVADWHEAVHETFTNQRPSAVNSSLPLIRYAPEKILSAQEKKITLSDLKQATKNPLGAPDVDDRLMQKLFLTFAPIWEIETKTGADLIGSPYWKSTQQPDVDTKARVQFTYPTYTRLNGHSLLQLNYVIWFKARPKTNIFDLLGGQLDGLTWRVTLGASGNPLLYDAIHNCGCYHMLFHGPGLTPKPTFSKNIEPPLLLPAPSFSNAQQITIKLSARDHQIQAVFSEKDTTSDISYTLKPYQELLALQTPKGYQSLFDKKGFISGTERAERFFFWPTGVTNAGAMRQKGRHVTAFISERHFDDPRLIEELFIRR